MAYFLTCCLLVSGIKNLIEMANADSLLQREEKKKNVCAHVLL